MSGSTPSPPFRLRPRDSPVQGSAPLTSSGTACLTFRELFWQDHLGHKRNEQRNELEKGKEEDIFNEDQTRLGNRRQDRYESKITQRFLAWEAGKDCHCPQPWQSGLHPGPGEKTCIFSWALLPGNRGPDTPKAECDRKRAKDAWLPQDIVLGMSIF